MAGPWEQYQPQPTAKPWEQYQSAPQADAPVTTPPAQQDLGWRGGALGGFIRGIRDPIDALAQMAERGAKGIGIDTQAISNFWGIPTADQATKAAEQDYQQNWRGRKPSLSDLITGKQPEAPFEPSRLAGNVVSTALITRGLGAPATVAGRAVQGAGLGLLQPVTDTDNFWAEKGKQAAGGAVGGVVAPAILGGAARIVQGVTDPAKKLLMQEGVRLTPGQLAGGVARDIENKATSLPFVGNMITGAQQQATQDLNRAAWNRALAPIGEKLPDGVVGREAADYTANKISGAYNNLLPKLMGRVDDQFAQDMQGIQSIAQNLPADKAAQVTNILQNTIGNKFTKSGLMSGETAKQVESDLGKLIQRYSSPMQTADDQAIGDALREAQSSFRQMIERVNPKYSGQLQAINSAFAQQVRPQQAAASLGSVEGVFSPAQLQNAVKAADKSARKNAFARGNATMQDLSDAARSVMPSTVPDSGTAGRAMLPLAAGGAGVAFPTTTLATMGGVGAAYTPQGQALLRALLASRPQSAQAVGNLLQQLGGPVAVPVGGLLGSQLVQ